jgi:hypothetical protein
VRGMEKVGPMSMDAHNLSDGARLYVCTVPNDNGPASLISTAVMDGWKHAWPDRDRYAHVDA